MSDIRFALRVICLFVVLSAIALHSCDARGGRGGGFRGGGRFSSSRSSSRSVSRSYRSSSLRRGTSPFTRSTWLAGAATIYGASYYMRRRSYYSNRNEMPTICDNRYDNSPNGTVYGYFICPKEGEDDDMTYCCGADHREYCCRFQDSPGRVTGIVIGCLIAVGVVGFIVFMLCRWKLCTKKTKACGSSGASVQYQVSQMPAATPAPYSTTVSKQLPYPTEPGTEKEPLPEGNAWGPNSYSPYPPMEGAMAPPAPPAYDNNSAMYPPPPTFPPTDPQPGAPGAYPSQPPPPYGFNQ